MQLYHVQFQQLEDLAIFANDTEEVVHLVDSYLSINQSANVDYQISHPIDLSHVSRLEFYQLQAAMVKNIVGCGIYDRENGWQIVPLAQYPLLPERELNLARLPTGSIGSDLQI